MKKVFNDHVGIWFIVALCIAGAALWMAISNRKQLKSHEERLPVLAPETTATEPTE